jgi:hypothetical protein
MLCPKLLQQASLSSEHAHAAGLHIFVLTAHAMFLLGLACMSHALLDAN